MRHPRLPRKYQEQLREEHREAICAARDFEYACKFGDPDKLLVAAGLLDETGDGWRLAMKRVAALGSVSKDIQKAFVNIWTQHKHLPLRVGHRPTTARALRVLLPKMKRSRHPDPRTSQTPVRFFLDI
jgi:hypothetical protein